MMGLVITNHHFRYHHYITTISILMIIVVPVTITVIMIIIFIHVPLYDNGRISFIIYSIIVVLKNRE